MEHTLLPIADGLLVQFGSGAIPRARAKGWREERNRIFKIPALGLKMVWTQIHPLGPHHPRQKFHNYRTIRRKLVIEPLAGMRRREGQSARLPSEF